MGLRPRVVRKLQPIGCGEFKGCGFSSHWEFATKPVVEDLQRVAFRRNYSFVSCGEWKPCEPSRILKSGILHALNDCLSITLACRQTGIWYRRFAIDLQLISDRLQTDAVPVCLWRFSLKLGMCWMNEKNIKLFKQINIWVYIIPFFLITALFSLRIYNAVEQKITDIYEHFTEDAADAARNYSYTLKKAKLTPL